MKMDKVFYLTDLKIRDKVEEMTCFFYVIRHPLLWIEFLELKQTVKFFFFSLNQGTVLCSQLFSSMGGCKEAQSGHPD